MKIFYFAVALLTASIDPATAQETATGAHGPQEEVGASVETAEVVKPAAGESAEATVVPRAATPSVDPGFIVFGYVQSEAVLPQVRFNALTHIGSLFVNFDANGNLTNPGTFTNRSASLRLNGAAHDAGVKVVVVVRNANFDETILTSVMDAANPSRYQNLANQIVSLVINDPYCAGVSFDFEFSWGSAVRDGIRDFLIYMRSVLPAQYEISVYTHAIYNSSRWNVAAMAPVINFMLYSMYDWGSGLTAHAISDFNNCLPYMNNYINAGLPPEKLVPTVSVYSRRWTGTNTYNGTGTSSNSQGFTNGLYDTTLEPSYGSPPPANNYVLGDEGAWYTYTLSGTPRTVTWDDLRSMEYKLRLALSMQDSSGTNSGRRLGGIGFWSLMWMANFDQSYNPIAGAVQTRRRTYPHIYQMCEEFYSRPGDGRYIFEAFEYRDSANAGNPSWSDPNESPDETGDTDNDSNISMRDAPAGAGRPASTTNAARLIFDFEAASGNRLFFRHQVLNDNGDSAVADINATACHVSRNSAFICPIFLNANYSPRTIRMALLDNLRQIEVSPPITLSTSGWQTLTWDLTDPAQIQAYNTNEPNLMDGNGVLNSAAGEEDISFLGFVIEGGGAGSGTIFFDELSYEHRNPGGRNYKINELRYAGNSGEFLEIAGPAGAFPANLQLRFYNSSNGSIASSVNLGGQSIPASGLFVVGDPGVTGAFTPAGWLTTSSQMNDTGAFGVQLFDTSTGCVYDSVVYQAMGGLLDLIRRETQNVTDEGWGWLGQFASGTNSVGAIYSAGRYSDGADTDVNEADFSFMPATPSLPNGRQIALGTFYNFETAPPDAFQTFQSFNVVFPPAPISPPPSGTRAYRCVDTTGGGVIGVIGDASLGANGQGYTVTGKIYIPASTTPAQAVAVGICGRQGSTFFSSTPGTSGYESGYWLIYENAAGVGLADGRADHPGTFEFVHATHNRMDGQIVQLLGSATRAATGAPNGGWADFFLTVDPDRAGEQLIIRINNTDIYRGNLPAGGPISGALQVGFRENHAGTPASTEGTWIDDVTIGVAVPVQISAFELF